MTSDTSHRCKSDPHAPTTKVLIMKRRSPRAGEAARIVLLFAFVFLAVPVVLVSLAILGYFTTAARAQDASQEAVMAQTRAQQAIAETARRQAEDALRQAPDLLRPVTETSYRTESYEVVTPYQDPESGEMKTVTTVHQRLVPVQSTRFTRSQVAARQDPAVPRLVSELLEMDEQDEKYEQKLRELRQRLDLEFTGMHEEQSKEIAAIEERLEALKKLHQHRDEIRDKIVQRRIDELLGRSDALAWEVDRKGPQPSQPPSPIDQFRPHFLPGTSHFLPGTSPPPTAPSPNIAPSPYAPVPPMPPTAPIPPRPAPATTLPRGTYLPGRLEEVEQTIIRDGAAGRVAANPIEANSSVISRIFEVARKLGAAEASLPDTESNLEQIKGMHEKNEIPTFLLQKTEANVAQIRREVKLSQLELEALAESIRRSQKFAETQLKNAQAALEVAKTRVRQGTAPTGDLIRAESEATAARERLEEAAANLEQLERAWELIRGSQTQADDAE